jgi:hypothetical protein
MCLKRLHDTCGIIMLERKMKSRPTKCWSEPESGLDDISAAVTSMNSKSAYLLKSILRVFEQRVAIEQKRRTDDWKQMASKLRIGCQGLV